MKERCPMRSWLVLAALLGLACASSDGPKDRVMDEAGPELQRIQNVMVAAVTTPPLDLSEGFADTLGAGGFGGPDLSGGTGSPTLSGGVGSPTLSGGVQFVGPGSVPVLPGSIVAVDEGFVDAVCDLFFG